MSPKIDFIGIAAAKSGTTWIHTCLSEHPDICMSSPKEMTFYKPGQSGPNIEAYTTHFTHCSNEAIRGEWTPFHMHSDEMVAFTKEHFPNTKFVAIFRNPVERYISSYYFHLKRGHQLYPTIEEKLEKELNAKDHESLTDLTRGKYFKELSRYLDAFPDNQFHIMVYEDMRKNPEGEMRKLLQFLEVDDSFIPPSIHHKKPKRAIVQRNTTLHTLLYRIRNLLINTPIAPFLRTLGFSKVHETLRKANTKESDSPATASDVVRKKLRTYYEADIKQLEKYLDRDLSSWV